MAPEEKQSVEMRPHHLERVLKHVTWGEIGEGKAKEGTLDETQLRGLKEEQTMYETLSNALNSDPDATVIFVKGFDSLCRRFCDPSKCTHHQEIIDTDQAVADALGLEFDKPYRIADVLTALQYEKEQNPRTFFAISRGHERLPEWRDSVRKLCLKAIE
jgi:hypothetical protein